MRARDLPPLKKLPASEWWAIDALVLEYVTDWTRPGRRRALKLAEITGYVIRKLKRNKTTEGATDQAVYVWVGASTQRLKKAGRIRLVTGNGAGWVAV